MSAKSIKKIACVGDSITEGAGTEHPETDSYPAQLAAMLGEGYEIKNFGFSGHTMLVKGDQPWIMHPGAKEALAMKADLVILMLGTNDAKPHNWQFGSELYHDATGLIRMFLQQGAKKIAICLPVPAVKEGQYGVTAAVVEFGVLPAIRNVVEKANVDLIDIHSPLKGKDHLFPDNVHPNTIGAKIIAQTVYNYVRSVD